MKNTIVSKKKKKKKKRLSLLRTLRRTDSKKKYNTQVLNNSTIEYYLHNVCVVAQTRMPVDVYGHFKLADRTDQRMGKNGERATSRAPRYRVPLDFCNGPCTVANRIFEFPGEGGRLAVTITMAITVIIIIIMIVTIMRPQPGKTKKLIIPRKTSNHGRVTNSGEQHGIIVGSVA